jgi:hypothetical protein
MRKLYVALWMLHLFELFSGYFVCNCIQEDITVLCNVQHIIQIIDPIIVLLPACWRSSVAAFVVVVRKKKSERNTAEPACAREIENIPSTHNPKSEIVV